MNEINRFELYEKLYFHEVEAREKLAARLQIPLALILSIISVYSVMIKGTDFLKSNFWNLLYLLFLGLSMLTFLATLSYFVRGFYGHTYEMIPSASDSEDYHKKLIDTYQNYGDYENLVRDAFRKYLFEYYASCSSNNTKVNDARSTYLHKCNTYLIITAIPLAVSFLIFSMAGINKNSDEKEYMVKIASPISLEYTGNIPDVDKVSETKIPQLEISDKKKEIVNEQRQEGRKSTTSSTTTADKSD
ncbi:hypothetical protein Q666_13270 [Marinobacter sp. ES-1]|uniref:hypothetical protein n=1 Tax=Marinobacter sp. ES-1 TaxID=1396858 RepID=UPI0003B8EF87|nr:hypothetical protein [Marinobacter sp. ES-1]ERP90556.1 hypothetical protein Q666_13270 [Marinobacter sp. ES-1]